MLACFTTCNSSAKSNALLSYWNVKQAGGGWLSEGKRFRFPRLGENGAVSAAAY